jgi:hypothetical protein
MHENIKYVDGIKYKLCVVCKEWLNWENDFYLRSNRTDSVQTKCKKCWNKDRENRRKRDPEKYKSNLRNRKLKQKFGITLDIYNDMFNKQKGLCFICQQNTDNFHKIGVDHNHETGQVRKLLCSQCNTGIGHAKEDYNILLKMIWYLYIHNNNLDITFEQFINDKYLDKIIYE